MAKSTAKIATEIQELLGLPPTAVKKWRTKMAAFRKAANDLAYGYTDAGMERMRKTRDAIDKAIYDAVAEVPYVPGAKQHLAPPILKMEAERQKLVDELWEPSIAKGRAANEQASRAELKRLDEAIRERDRPYDWMRR